MSSAQQQPIKAVLFDMDGVLYVGDEMIKGAAAAVQAIRDAGLAIAAVTNTTTRSKRMLAEKLARMGIAIVASEIYTPAALAMQLLNGSSARLYIRDALLEDFHGCQIDELNPDYIVMGDIGGEGYSPDMLLEIFRLVMNGSRLVCLHKNRFWQKPDGLHLDLGPFVAAIEYATGKQATVLGKPSTDFFHGVCKALGVQPASALMIGDDIESDIAGAQHAGLQTALVQTGKYRADFVKETGIEAGITLASVAELPSALKQKKLNG